MGVDQGAGTLFREFDFSVSSASFAKSTNSVKSMISATYVITAQGQAAQSVIGW